MNFAEAEARCALIDLSTDDPVRLAKVLKKSWMEGGVKRGLTGTVLYHTHAEQFAVALAPLGAQALRELLLACALLARLSTAFASLLCPVLGLAGCGPNI